jgi:hypothetical protein
VLSVELIKNVPFNCWVNILTSLRPKPFDLSQSKPSGRPIPLS